MPLPITPSLPSTSTAASYNLYCPPPLIATLFLLQNTTTFFHYNHSTLLRLGLFPIVFPAFIFLYPSINIYSSLLYHPYLPQFLSPFLPFSSITSSPSITYHRLSQESPLTQSTTLIRLPSHTPDLELSRSISSSSQPHCVRIPYFYSYFPLPYSIIMKHSQPINLGYRLLPRDADISTFHSSRLFFPLVYPSKITS